ncbi:MAG: hypothetical protein IJI21_02800 [Clostridia bacterium]|nr:hypothetical protein [Clostridia bacterium]
MDSKSLPVKPEERRFREEEWSGLYWTRISDPIKVNDVLSLCSMFAAKPQDLVVMNHQNPSNSTRVAWLYRWGKLLSTIIQNEKHKMKMTKKVK